ncbi:hypothetical protein [Lentilactobacillus otakiensis]|uniref:Uncharacterized protein n=2 Tax=Lentilactobacillus otakiensis TaxID=481720 RepID=S4NQT5_9LACO|nr:hypothetical protein [Lentilactobacillus otakiensis]GAD16393.1 hypothetical protein LOT_0931 [Lentilactobacillus otakiensis DSM 19908 = JCM 15040]
MVVRGIRMVVEYFLIIGIACSGLVTMCISVLWADRNAPKPLPPEPRLYEGKLPKFDVEVEPGTYQYDPQTGETNIPVNEFDLWMLYTIDNLPRERQVLLNDVDLNLTQQLKNPEGDWSQFPLAVQEMPMIWTIADHGMVLLRIR